MLAVCFIYNFILKMTAQYDNIIEYSTVTGTVTSSKKFSETDVRVGVSTYNDGTLADVYTSSNSYINHEIWLTTDTGKETSVKLHDGDIPLREGQRVTIICLDNKGISNTIPSVIINHNNGQWYKTMSDARACVALRLCNYQKNINYEMTLKFAGIIFAICIFFSLTIAHDALKKYEPLFFFVSLTLSVTMVSAMVFYRKSKNKQIQEIINDFNSKLHKTMVEVSQQIL